MHTRGRLSPETQRAASDQYDDLGLAAQVVVKESARAMSFDGDEYADRVTSDVVSTARDALFASLLSVTIGTQDEFDDWTAGRDVDVVMNGSENVDRVVWHHVQFADAVIAATFENEEDAAVATLQRIAYGRFYRSVV